MGIDRTIRTMGDRCFEKWHAASHVLFSDDHLPSVSDAWKMYERMYHPPSITLSRVTTLLLSATPKHTHIDFYPPLLPLSPSIYHIHIYIYESIKCRLCLSGTKTLKRIIGHFSCLSDSSVLRVQSRRCIKEGAEERKKESRSLRSRFNSFEEKNY